MSVIFIKKQKNKISECDAGGVSSPMCTLDNVGGMGNPIPPSENSLGSGDSFGKVVGPVSTKSSNKKFKLIRKRNAKV